MRMLRVTILCALTTSACAVAHTRPGPTSSAASSMVTEDVDSSDEIVGRRSATANGQSEFEYRRHHSAAGQFVTADVLAASGDMPLITVLKTHILGFGGDGRAMPPTGNCGVDVFVNGLRVIDVLDELHPRDLIGVEYYEAASAPVKYRRAFSSCPILLLWLKFQR